MSKQAKIEYSSLYFLFTSFTFFSYLQLKTHTRFLVLFFYSIFIFADVIVIHNIFLPSFFAFKFSYYFPVQTAWLCFILLKLLKKGLGFRHSSSIAFFIIFGTTRSISLPSSVAFYFSCSFFNFFIYFISSC